MKSGEANPGTFRRDWRCAGGPRSPERAELTSLSGQSFLHLRFTRFFLCVIRRICEEGMEGMEGICEEGICEGMGSSDILMRRQATPGLDDFLLNVGLV